MKTSEFIEKMKIYCEWLNSKIDSESVSYRVKDDVWDNVMLEKHETIDTPIIRVSKDEVNDYSFRLSPEVSVKNMETVRMLSSVVDYAETPLSEREDEKRWHIHLCEDEDEYLNLNKKQGVYDINNKAQTIHHKTKFTRSEIEEWAGTNSDEIIDWIIDKFGEEVK